MKAAKTGNRHGRRDALMILMAFRHALRPARSSICAGSRSTSKRATLHVRRAKAARHRRIQLTGRELRELRRHQREQHGSPSFSSLNAARRSQRRGFRRMVERAGVDANLGIKVHAHMLRHACGFKLANDGHDTRSIQAYMGHRNIQNTARYTALAPGRFKNFWRD